MFIGKWNKSVIITYLGTVFAASGIVLALGTHIKDSINYSICCLILAGICDLFDGTYARHCKRDDEEKAFGVQIDSLADVVDFVALPIAIYVGAGLNQLIFIPFYALFAICGVARLAYFNISTADKEKAVGYYLGLPVTCSAITVPVVMLFQQFLPHRTFVITCACCIFLNAIFNILKIKIKKPHGIAYIFFSALALFMLIMYGFIL